MNGYTVEVVPVPEAGAEEVRCLATVTSDAGVRTAVAEDSSIEINAATGTSFNGVPGVVFEGYSGGAHCCWTYWFVSLAKSPVVLATLENQRAIRIEIDESGRTLLHTYDGVFDYFDGLCHACSAFPLIVLELRQNRLYDVGSQFVSNYDKEIAEARKELNKSELEKFHSLSSYDSSAKAQFEQTIPLVLQIVVDYLYSGRETQAWQALDEMWPASDKNRIKELILETRRKGILAQLGRP